MVFTIIYIFQSHGNNRNHILIQSVYQHISSTYVFHVYHLSTSNEHPTRTSWGLMASFASTMADWSCWLHVKHCIYDTIMIPLWYLVPYIMYIYIYIYYIYIHVYAIYIYIYTHLYLYLCLCLYTCIIRTCWTCFQIQISHGHGSFRVAGNDNPATVELGPQYLLSHHRRLGLKFASIWGFPARHGGTQ